MNKGSIEETNEKSRSVYPLYLQAVFCFCFLFSVSIMEPSLSQVKNHPYFNILSKLCFFNDAFVSFTSEFAGELMRVL